MSVRRLLIAGVAVLVSGQMLGAGNVVSATTGPCHVVLDPRGDVGVVPVEGGLPTAGGAVDIVSGDIASDDRYLIVDIRVAKLDRPSGVGETRQYDFDFDATPHETYELSAIVGATGRPSFEALVGPSYSPNDDDAWTTYAGDGIGAAQGAVDWKNNEIRMWVKLRKLRAYGRLGTVVSHLRVRTWRDEDEFPLAAGYREDLAKTSSQYRDRYRLGDPSCLTA